MSEIYGLLARTPTKKPDQRPKSATGMHDPLAVIA